MDKVIYIIPFRYMNKPKENAMKVGTVDLLFPETSRKNQTNDIWHYFNEHGIRTISILIDESLGL